MERESTPKHTVPHERPDSSVAPKITLIVLFSGVIVGLFIVVTVFLICKFCVKRKKALQRQPVVPRERPYERRVRGFQRYETINSDIFSENSSASVDGLPVSPCRLTMEASQELEKFCEEIEPTETTRLKGLIQRGESAEEPYDAAEGGETSPADGVQATKEGRRVSFQLDNLPSSTAKYLRKGRRYTEGDFHYLKRLRIERLLAGAAPRQYSLGSRYAIDSEPAGVTAETSFTHKSKEMSGQMQQQSSSMLVPFQTDDSPSPTSKPQKTEVSVEVHCRPNSRAETSSASDDSSQDKCSPPKPLPLPSLDLSMSVLHRMKSHSLDTVSPINTWQLPDCSSKRVYDDATDYDTLKITEFTRGPFHNADFEINSEIMSPKIRYNDTGSLEQLNECHFDYFGDFDLNEAAHDESDDTETLNGTQKYRELWNLRATLEEEEECSDTIRMEDTTSPDQSPEAEPCTTSFESNTEPTNCREDKECSFADRQKPAGHLLHPNYESRRQSYKDILHKRLQKPQQHASADNSFDSMETVDTDGDVSDTSRHEVTTTSFESTTDNTDSTTESQTSKLRQMKADSGYKSLETQPQPANSGGGARKPAQQFSSSSLDREDRLAAQQPPLPAETPVKRYKKTMATSHFDRRNGKTASKKRREYSRERQIIHVYESINEPETDSKSDQPSGDSFEDNSLPGKLSVFTRFFRAHHRESKERGLSRDYSIDEKSNELFNEFVRQDPRYEAYLPFAHRSPRLHPRHRLHRKQTDPSYYNGRQHDHLVPGMRSTSLGSDSSASSVRRLSPQDSIEEEYYEEEKPWEEAEHIDSASQRLSIHDLPVIKLPEEDAIDA